MINDCLVRSLIINAVPNLHPSRLEVEMVDYDAATAYVYRDGPRILKGRTPAIQRTEQEIASALAANLTGQMVEHIIATSDISPYEGKPGRHPENCTCSKHLKAVNGQAQ